MEQSLQIQEIKVTLEGLSDIMFDQFTGQQKDTKPPEQKLYLAEGNAVVLPSENIWAFLFGENPAGCAKSFQGKQGREYMRVGQSHTAIEPLLIPFLREGKPVVFEQFDDKVFSVSHFAPRTKLGSLSIKQDIKLRPVLKIPWSLAFTIKLVQNNRIDAAHLQNWFETGGILIGLGTYRPRFGRFMVSSMEIAESRGPAGRG